MERKVCVRAAECFAQVVISHHSRLSNSGGWCSSWSGSGFGACTSNAVRLGLGAILRDVTNFSTAVAGLAALAVEWAAVWCRAIPADVPKLAAGVALHALSLAVACVVVWSAALVASCSAGHATAIAASETATTATEATSWWSTAGRRAVASKVTWLAARVAAAAGGTAQTQSWAVSLDVAKTLAVVALLRCPTR